MRCKFCGGDDHSWKDCPDPPQPPTEEEKQKALADWMAKSDHMMFVDNGISLRDWFAGMAIQALLTHFTPHTDTFDASVAYTIADKMLEARKR